MHHIEILIRHYGYFAIVFIFLTEMLGAPFPAETTLTLCGIEWAHGNFSFAPLWISAALGNIVGSSISYAIGKSFGYRIITKYGKFVRMPPERFERLQGRVSRYRYAVVFFGKFVSGVRVITPLVAGMDRMSFIRFTTLNSLSALCWSCFFIFEGRYFSKLWTSVHPLQHPVGFVVLATLVTTATSAHLISKHRRRKVED